MTSIPHAPTTVSVRMVAVRGRYRRLFTGDPNSAYVRALRSAGWTVTILGVTR